MSEQLFILLMTLGKILIVLVPVLIGAAYFSVVERKVLAYMQARVGPNRVGFKGMLQPIADAIKLMCKELIVPTASNKILFFIAPIITVVPALAAWSIIPFSPTWVIANVNAGLLFVLALTSLGVYGVLIAGWASNSKYAMFGALRSAAQVISYEIAMGFTFIGVLLATGTMNLQSIVLQQAGGFWHWYWLPLFPLFIVYWISGVAETNRAPFDVAEGESEIVAGFHVEYSGMGFVLFFLGEYANMILIGAIASLIFFGGWLSPFEGIPWLGPLFSFVPGLAWFLIKISFFCFLYLWMRATFPRYRYDQIMHLGWKVLIPVTVVWLIVVALAVQFHIGYWFQ